MAEQSVGGVAAVLGHGVSEVTEVWQEGFRVKKRFAFPLNIQLPFMEATTRNQDFADVLKLLQAEGFSGVELNLDCFDDPDGVRGLLAQYDLRLSMAASGAYAVRHGLSLSAADESVREAAVAAVRKMLSFAAAVNDADGSLAGGKTGVICGFMKGAAKQDADIAAAQMRKSLDALEGAAAPLYLEATNHYEATLVNTLAEGAAMVGERSNIHVLPDTYHMNIGERDTAAALARYAGMYRNVHLSDNNRYFPGFGAIDFRAVYALLHGLGYDGVTAVEGRTYRSLREDIVETAAYLESCSRGLVR